MTYGVSFHRNLRLHLLVVLHVDLRVFPLASRDLAFEHDVDLAVRATPHLWQEEVCHDQAEQPSASPDISALAAKVSASRVQHVRRNWYKLVSVGELGSERKDSRKMQGISTM
jgi:hypothetical protein